MSASRILIILGIVILIAGGLLYLAERFNLHLGHLPGDFRFQRGNLSLYIPCGTSILLSILLTLLLTLLSRYFRK